MNYSRPGERPAIPGVGPTGETHCSGGQIYRFIVREGPPSHGGPQARLNIGSYYRKCMGCGVVLPDEPQIERPSEPIDHL